MQMYTFFKMKLPSDLEMRLLALVSATERSGREVAQLFKEETQKPLSYGTLYTTFRRLKTEGWVSVRDDTDKDGRIRYFRITGAGVRALMEARKYHERLAGFGISEAPA